MEEVASVAGMHERSSGEGVTQEEGLVEAVGVCASVSVSVT